MLTEADRPQEELLHRVEFNPLIRPYLMLYVAGLMTISMAGVVLLPVWLLGLGQWWSRHYFQRLECELSSRRLRYRKGILVTVEKTIPLKNIQDVTFVEGPLLRYFHLAILKFETAGQSAGQAHDMKLVGIIGAREFRDRILEARDRLRAQTGPDRQVELLAGIQADVRAMLDRMKER